jgi:hypothetical protein
MYVPITSEITIEIGTVLREISTDQLFQVAERVHHGAEVAGDDTWKITPAGTGSADRPGLQVTRVQLAQKYFAEV